jgi:hypothetical protein
MRGCCLLVAAAIAAAGAQATSISPAAIKHELEQIKQGRTLAILQATGTDDSGGATLLRFDNPSPFKLVVLIVGPTTERIEIEADRMQTLTIEPGDYEIAVRVVGRDVPPFYGRQKIEPNRLFRQKFIIPTI